MNNIDRWRNYMRDVNSPDSFVDMGFYYMISCCLARRVWVNPDHTPLFPSQYIVLVGPPGVGKGRVIKPVTKFLKFWMKDEQLVSNLDKQIDKKDNTDIDDILEQAAEQTNEPDAKRSPLVHMGAESTTYQALMRYMARAITVDKVPEGFAFGKSGVYRHRSIAFALEEWSSLVKKDTENIMQFFLQSFDCGDYHYDTKHQGSDKLKNMCLNMIAGTTPKFMSKSISSDVVDDGFSARTLFVFEFTQSKRQFGIFEHDHEQKQDRKEILKQLLRISTLKGRVEYTPEAFEYMKWYFEDHLHEGGRVNNNVKLDSYYTRRDMHTHKMAMAVHFADSLDMTISKATVEKAIKILEGLERNMHYALAFGDNPLGTKSKEIQTFLKKFGAGFTFDELLVIFNADLREDELKECLRYCTSSKNVRLITGEDNKERYQYSDL
jgi:hypothetical protein